jgi:hypothetical protein
MRKIPLDFSLYENVYTSDIPFDQYYVILFDSLPSKFANRANYSKDIIKYFNEIGFVEECRIVNGRRYAEQVSESILIHKGKKIMISVIRNLIKEPDLVSLIFGYNIQDGEIHQQIDMEHIQKYKTAQKTSTIQLVKSVMGNLDSEEYDLISPEFDLELNYGKDFIKLHDIMIERLNTPDDKGIIVLYGEHGTGKTTYIRALTKLIIDKDVLFIPPSMAEMLSEPSIIPFLMEHRNSILIIEDGEQVIGDRRGKASSAGVSNILNLTDGLLGDCLKIQVITTCNIPREKIDPALLRRGRLICEHRFDKLSIADTNILLNHLKKGVTSNIPLTLADIYNIDVDANRSPDPELIGFKMHNR